MVRKGACPRPSRATTVLIRIKYQRGQAPFLTMRSLVGLPKASAAWWLRVLTRHYSVRHLLPSTLNYVTLPDMPDASATLEQVFRAEHGRIIATLIRISGSFDLAEEALQEAFTSAAAHWKEDGPPESPGAWLTTVAHRKLLDRVRRDKRRAEKEPELQYETE